MTIRESESNEQISSLVSDQDSNDSNSAITSSGGSKSGVFSLNAFDLTNLTSFENGQNMTSTKVIRLFEESMFVLIAQNIHLIL